MTQTALEPLQDSFTLVLSTIPMIYRSSMPRFNELLDRYDRAISELSQVCKTSLIDLGGLLQSRQESTGSTYFPPSRASLNEDAALLHQSHHAEQRLKEERGLTLSVDGIHLDSTAAAIVAQGIDAFFRQTLHVSDTF